MANVYIASSVEQGGLYHYKTDWGQLTFVEKTPMKNPVYSVVQDGKIHTLLKSYFGKDTALVTNLLNADGTLGPGTVPVSTLGQSGCHLAAGEEVYVANYQSGTVFRTPDRLAVHRGSSLNPERQEGPHPHFVCRTPDGYLCAVDLGLDQLILYTTELEPVSKTEVCAGYGPRHMIFSSCGGFAYVACELSSTVEVYSYRQGSFTWLDSVPCLPEGVELVNYPAAIRIWRNYLYVSNRGHDSVSVFCMEGSRLHPVAVLPCGGAWPRDMHIGDDLLICANEKGDTVTVFALREDGTFGTPVQTIPVPNPRCVCIAE